jgi:hypothetical protein
MWNLVLKPIFVFGSIPWIVVSVAAFLLLSYALFERRNSIAFSAVGAWLGLTIVFGDMTLINHIMTDPIGSAILVLEIIGAGALWCLFAWGITTVKRRQKYEKLKFDWLRSKGIEVVNTGGWSIFSKKEITIPVHLRQAWTEYLCSKDEYHSEFSPNGWWVRVGGNAINNERDLHFNSNITNRKPVVKLYWWDYSKKHVREIVFWIPLSIWWVLTGMGGFVSRRVVKSISFIGEYISSFAFRGVDKDFEVPKAEAVEEPASR